MKHQLILKLKLIIKKLKFVVEIQVAHLEVKGIGAPCHVYVSGAAVLLFFLVFVRCSAHGDSVEETTQPSEC
jgi:hypothetical protein